MVHTIGRGSSRRGKAPVTDTSNREDVEAEHPMQPLKLFFSQSEYGTTCKVSSRCEIPGTLKLLKKLDNSERRWFEHHPQFKHLWHMVAPQNKMMGLWLLVVRSVATDKKKECWFVVNGVPVRYSLREHALICGFDCHEYPVRYKDLGSMDFVRRIFGRETNIVVKDVEEKFEKMKDKCDGDRLKMAVLLFLAKIIRGRKKQSASIDPFLLRIVDDLEACKNFPWGRLTFEDNVKEIVHMVEHFKGKAQTTWSFPGFSIPLQVLAFEAIPILSSKFQDVAPNAHRGCPRICKKSFKSITMRGFPLVDLYDAIGTTKDIHSILEPSPGEEALLLRLMGRDAEEDEVDPIVDSWIDWLEVKERKIWWRELHKLDVVSRGGNSSCFLNPSDSQEPSQPSAHPSTPVIEEDKPHMGTLEERLRKTMEDGFRQLHEKVDGFGSRLLAVEMVIKDYINLGHDAGRSGFDETRGGGFDESGGRSGFFYGGPSGGGDYTEAYVPPPPEAYVPPPPEAYVPPPPEVDVPPLPEAYVSPPPEEDVPPPPEETTPILDPAIVPDTTPIHDPTPSHETTQAPAPTVPVPERKRRFKQCAHKKNSVPKKRKLRPSKFVTSPYTEGKKKD